MTEQQLYLLIFFLGSVAGFYWALSQVRSLRKIPKKDFEFALKKLSLLVAIEIFAVNAGYQSISGNLPQLAQHPVDIIGAFLCSYLLALSVLNTANKKTLPVRELLYAASASGLCGYLLSYFYHLACGNGNLHIHPWMAFFSLFITFTTSALVTLTIFWLKGYDGQGQKKLQLVFALEIALGLLASYTAINLSFVRENSLVLPVVSAYHSNMTTLLVLVPVLLLITSVMLVMFYQRIVDVGHSKAGLNEMNNGNARHNAADPLTNLPNRDALNQHLLMTSKRCDRHQDSMALAYIDLDHFKPVNDQFGHHIGDLLLIEASKRIVNALRNCDYVARAGGDEFIAVLSEIENHQSLVTVVQRIVDALREIFIIENHVIEISCSIGVSIYPKDGNLEKLKVNADAAMYKAKQNGKNQFRFYDAEIEQASDEMQQTRVELKQAISQREFKLFYQPKVDSITQQIKGAEALLRWQHPIRGILSPASFIEAAERFGMIEEINAWVMTQACQTIQQAKQMGVELSLSVNLSNQQFRNKHLSEHIGALVEMHSVNPGQLIFEISETNAIHHQEQFKETLTHFKQLGLKVSIDDFGLHAFSIDYLKTLAINEVKLDQTLTKDIADRLSSRKIVEAVIMLAHALDLNVVAEGVENAEQAIILAQSGCDQMQGYLFSMPLEREQFFEVLQFGLSSDVLV